MTFKESILFYRSKVSKKKEHGKKHLDTFRRKGRFPGLNGKLTGVLYVDGVKKRRQAKLLRTYEAINFPSAQYSSYYIKFAI